MHSLNFRFVSSTAPFNFPPQRKYQQEGGSAAKDAIETLRSWSTAPVFDLTHFLNLLIFNVIIGNADAHGKNLFWLYEHPSRRLAPAYDLVSTTLWTELSKRMAMRIGQAKFIDEVTLNHFTNFAVHNRIGNKPFEKPIQTLCNQILSSLPETLQQATTLSEKNRTQLEQKIRFRAGKLLPK